MHLMISLPRSLIAIEAWGSSCTTVVIASLVAVNGYFHGDRPVGLNESANVTDLFAHSGKESCAMQWWRSLSQDPRKAA
jgi:hypothetical protein